MTKAECNCDGYHTFSELYEHRHALFAALCNRTRSFAWKSWKHSDDSMFKDMFIAGVDTPDGPITYHLPKSWWGELRVVNLDKAPAWDGHTSDDVIKRLKSIK